MSKMANSDLSVVAVEVHTGENVAKNKTRVKQKQVRYTTTLPEDLYLKLDDEAIRLSVSKKSLIVRGLRALFEQKQF